MTVSAPMAAYGYRYDAPRTASVGGQKAQGLSYRYTAEDTAMYGGSYVLKHKKTIWYLHLYAREAQREESLAVWRAFLAAVAWKS